MAGTSLNGLLASRVRLQGPLVAIGLGMMTLVSATLTLMAWAHSQAIAVIVALLVCNSLGVGLAMPVITHRVLMPLPRLTGFATAAQGFLMMAMGSLGGSACAWMSRVLGGRAMPLTMLIFVFLALGLFGLAALRSEDSPLKASEQEGTA